MSPVGGRRSKASVPDLVEAARKGEARAVARLISLVEDQSPLLREVMAGLAPHAGNAQVVGVTGSPGVGKSTSTNALVAALRAHGKRVGVLAVDPSSPFSGGALLGDRVRMQDHALDRGVFIRSMATRGHLGGLALATPEAIRALDAAGFPIVLVETVGVGQIEVDIAASADTTVVVMNPGAGDAVQALKAGLLEIADVFVINKADRPGVKELQRDLNTMLDMDTKMGEWRPPIVTAVASAGEGIDELWSAVGEHRAYLERSAELEGRRRRRIAGELREIVVRSLERRAQELTGGPDFRQVRAQVEERQLDPYTAADQILRALG